MKIVIVETENGEQEFFDTFSAGLRFVRLEENKKHHSVEYLAMGDEDNDLIVYRGLTLRQLMRSCDNEILWIRAGVDLIDDE